MRFERVHSPDFCDCDPGEHDDHRHLKRKLEQISNEDPPQTTNKSVQTGERNKDEDADGQGGLLGITQGEMKTCELEHAALCNHWTEEHRDDADHRFCDPSQNEAVHKQSEIDGLKSAKECGRFSAVADFTKLNVGKNFSSPPVARKEEDGKLAAEAEPQPDQIAGNPLPANDSEMDRAG